MREQLDRVMTATEDLKTLSSVNSGSRHTYVYVGYVDPHPKKKTKEEHMFV